MSDLIDSNVNLFLVLNWRIRFGNKKFDVWTGAHKKIIEGTFSHPRRPRGSQSGRGEKARGTKVFKYRRKSPWVPTLTELFSKIQADVGSWLGTTNALYYCAQSANSLSWVLFASSYTTTIVAITACLDHALKKCTQSGNFPFDIKSPSDFKILSARKLKTLFQKYKLELTKGIHACIGHVLRNYWGVFKR